MDATWYEIFGRAKLTRVAKVLMRIDDAAKEVRSVDQMWSVEWRAGVPFNRFSTKEMKSPLQQVVTERGWIWRGVAFGKL